MDSIRRLKFNLMLGDGIKFGEYTDFPEIGMHGHNYYELIFFKKANSVSTVNGREIVFNDMSLYLLTPFDFHSTKKADTSHGAHYINVSFTADSVDNDVLKQIKGAYYLKNIDEDGDIVKLIWLLGYYNSINDQKSKSDILNVLIKRIVDLGELIIGESDVDTDRDTIRRAARFISENYAEEITLKTVADELHFSPTYFSSVFSKSAGVTFTEYLQKYRLNVAKNLLISTDKPIIEVSMLCGFNSYSSFSRVFKDNIGITPTEFRQSRTAKQIKKIKKSAKHPI